MSFKATGLAAIAASLLAAAPVMAEGNIHEFGGGFFKDLDTWAVATTADCEGDKMILLGAGGEVRALWVQESTWPSNQMRVMIEGRFASSISCVEGTLVVMTQEPTDIVYMKVGEGVEISYIGD